MIAAANRRTQLIDLNCRGSLVKPRLASRTGGRLRHLLTTCNMADASGLAQRRKMTFEVISPGAMHANANYYAAADVENHKVSPVFFAGDSFAGGAHHGDGLGALPDWDVGDDLHKRAGVTQSQPFGGAGGGSGPAQASVER